MRYVNNRLPALPLGHHTASIRESQVSFLLDSDSETTAQHIALLEKGGTR